MGSRWLFGLSGASFLRIISISKYYIEFLTLPGFMHTKTAAGLRDLVKALGILVVVTPQKPSVAGSADAPSEILTASCRNSGLADAYDSGLEEE